LPDTPIVLAFDTSAAHCAAALLSGGRIVGTFFEERDRGQAETLFPSLDRLLATAGVAMSDLTGIGVGTGPGNFTGLRIAISAARGLALGLGVPAVGVSVFDVARAELGAPVTEILLPAPRGAAYRMRFSDAPADTAPELVQDAPADRIHRIDWADGGLAALGRLADARLSSGAPVARPTPLYVRPADAAPARDAAPMILP
jgi:tRNA threonylcarbamoyl adenosine modification protein YeaZ